MAPSELAELLESSTLSIAKDAALALRSGWAASDFGPAESAELLRIYAIRAEHLASKTSPHAKQLRASILEFVENLRNAGAVKLGWIRGPAKYHFVVALADSPRRAIGAMKVVSKLDVSAEQWEALWRGEQSGR